MEVRLPTQATKSTCNSWGVSLTVDWCRHGRPGAFTSSFVVSSVTPSARSVITWTILKWLPRMSSLLRNMARRRSESESLRVFFNLERFGYCFLHTQQTLHCEQQTKLCQQCNKARNKQCIVNNKHCIVNNNQSFVSIAIKHVTNTALWITNNALWTVQ